MQSKPRVVKKILRHYITYRTNPGLSERFWDITVHYMQSKSRVVRKILRHYCTLHAEQIQGCQKDPETLDCATMQATLGIISVMSSFFKLSHKHSEQLMFFSELNLGKSCSLTKTLHKHCLRWKNNVTSHDNWP